MQHDEVAPVPQPVLLSPADIGVKMYTYLPATDARLTVTGGSTSRAGTDDPSGDRRNKLYGFADDLTMVRGSHQLGFGANVQLLEVRHAFHLAHRRRLDHSTAASTGLGLADFLTGRVAQARDRRPERPGYRQLVSGHYGQDTWRVSSRVTVNAGVRWEPYFGQIRRATTRS